MSMFSNFFGGSKKVNLTPDVTTLSPQEVNPKMYGSLSDLAKNYMKGPGFGDDFLGKATNPAIANIDANFQNRTMPTLSNEASKRGLARSSIVQDQIGQADLQRNRDINQLMSQFYTLNEQQKKNDTQFGAGLGQDILGGDVASQHARVAESERLANATAADARGRETADNTKFGQFLQAGAQLAVPALGGLSSLSGMAGMSGISDLLSKAQGGMSQFNNATKTKMLGDDELDALIESLRKGR